jgi:cytochrome c-type biogenesis protein CcmE
MSNAPQISVSPVNRGSAWKIVLSVVTITGAVTILLRSSFKESAEYYKYVDEVVADAGHWQGKRLHVYGHVVPGSIERAKNTLMYRFKIETGAMSVPEPRKASVITATYSGLVPDTFKDGAEVVAMGTLTPDGRVEAYGIMAKCPSKYQTKVTAKIEDPTAAANAR